MLKKALSEGNRRQKRGLRGPMGALKSCTSELLKYFKRNGEKELKSSKREPELENNFTPSPGTQIRNTISVMRTAY